MSKKYPVNELVEGMIVDEGVYGEGETRVPLVAKNQVLTNYLIEKLRTNGVATVKILAQAGNSKMIDIQKRPPIITPRLRKEALDFLQDTFSFAAQMESGNIVATRTVKKLDTLVSRLIVAITRDKQAMVNINDLKSYDEYTYHHSLSVAVLAIAIAHQLGFSGVKLTQLGKTAIMHDIGKTRVPIQLINKPAKLDQEEFHIVQTHSQEGYRFLVDQGIGDTELWASVKHHHEKMDGSGYPNGLEGEDIPVMSRIIAVADVYDALTSKRPYRKPIQPAEALEYIMGGSGTFFDYDMVLAFIKKIDPYPKGTLVELSNDKIAIVVDNEFPMRPVVQTLSNGEILDLNNDRRCLSILIRNTYDEMAMPG